MSIETTPQVQTIRELKKDYHDYLLKKRKDIYNDISRTRLTFNKENGVIRKEIQKKIAALDEPIRLAQKAGIKPIEDLLIKSVQELNRERHQNRLRVKELSNRQTINKMKLAQLNRSISYFEDSGISTPAEAVFYD